MPFVLGYISYSFHFGMRASKVCMIPFGENPVLIHQDCANGWIGGYATYPSSCQIKAPGHPGVIRYGVFYGHRCKDWDLSDDYRCIKEEDLAANKWIGLSRIPPFSVAPTGQEKIIMSQCYQPVAPTGHNTLTPTLQTTFSLQSSTFSLHLSAFSLQPSAFSLHPLAFIFQPSTS
jgi:hypothetical protein